MSSLLTGSERERLDPFVALADDGISMRDQRDLMSQPFSVSPRAGALSRSSTRLEESGSRCTVFPSMAWQPSGMPMC
jgi:hypothetical protein